MGVTESDLIEVFTSRTMKLRKETYKVPLNAKAAKEATDALAKEAYQKVFFWVVDAINSGTAVKKEATVNYGVIGMLDIFGFESFLTNRFEQLCINYANEKLQQKFTEDIFRNVQEEYKFEGIPLTEIHYDDNTDVLDLIEGRTGLLAILNEECIRPKGSDFDFVQKALALNKSSPCLVLNCTDCMLFGVKYYAGKVMYDGEFFVQSNQDTLPTDLQSCASKSSNDIIWVAGSLDTMVAFADAPKSGARRKPDSNLAAPTVWTKYKSQLNNLMAPSGKPVLVTFAALSPTVAKNP
jgi:myosin-5